MGLIVQEFGGTSLRDAERIHRAARRDEGWWPGSLRNQYRGMRLR